jgi:hypothetical protein
VYQCEYRRGKNWLMDLLTTYTHDSELQAITAPSLISTLYKSPQHTLSLFQPAVSSLAVPWQRILTVEILQLHALRSSLHSLPRRTQLSTKFVPYLLHLCTDHIENTPFPTGTLFCVRIRCCGNVFTEPLPGDGRRSRSHSLGTGLYAAVFRIVT